MQFVKTGYNYELVLLKGGDAVKIKVIKCFNDKQNNLVTRKVGTVFDCSKERAAELINKGFVVEVKSEKKAKN